MFIVLCTVNFVVLYLCVVLVSCIVSLYLWGARLQAQPSVQPLSLTKIDKNKNNIKYNRDSQTAQEIVLLCELNGTSNKT